MSNEAYASQYIDHHVEPDPTCGPVVMSRQNLAQGAAHPWIAHACLDHAAGFATDAMQLLGPAYRDEGRIDPALDLPNRRLQHEVACPILRSPTAVLAPGASATWTFFALYVPDHPEASGPADLARVDEARAAGAAFAPRPVRTSPPAAEPPPGRAAALRPRPSTPPPSTPTAGTRSATAAACSPSSFPRARTPATSSSATRSAASPAAMAPSCAAARACSSTRPPSARPRWMHGVFASLLSVGNTSFHRLFAASRDPYDITRAGGLRLLVDTRGDGWRLLAEPSAFEIGLSDCRWIYRLADRTVTVRASPSGDDPALRIRVTVEGAPCRFLAFSALVLGEREYDHAGRVTLDPAACRAAFRPDPGWLWGKAYPDAVYHLVTATPDAVEAIGGDELLHADGARRAGGFIAVRTRADRRPRPDRRRRPRRPRRRRGPRREVRRRRRRGREPRPGHGLLAQRHPRRPR